MRERLTQRAALVLGGLLLALAGCASATKPPPDVSTGPVPVGVSTGRITVDGLQRDYRLYRPASLPAHAPLVVMLHGGFGTAAQAESAYGWDRLADAEHFVVLYPDGHGRAWNSGGGCCGLPARQNLDDVAFVTQLVASLGQRLPLDPARRYVTGISNGGMMAYRLACQARLFAAAGIDSATQLGSCPSPAPISLLHIHGTADHNIPYLGGQGSGFARIDGPPVPTVVAGWRAVDHCAAPTLTTAGPVTTSLATCPDGHAVELITLTGAGHQWPGSRRTAAQHLLGLDPPSTALDATSVFWHFFAAHPAPS